MADDNEFLTRQPAIQGTFYPFSKEEIIAFIEKTQEKEKDQITKILNQTNEQKINGLIVPHAGWVYSGKTALLAYKILEKIKPKKIVMLGPSHQFASRSFFTDETVFWKSPLGVSRLIKEKLIHTDLAMHLKEHCLEVQLPFIQYYSSESEILPILIGDLSKEDIDMLVKYIIEKNYFVIISTDLSHFFEEKIANDLDNKSIDHIKKLEAFDIDACGFNALRVCIEYCKRKNTKPTLIDYTTSANTTKDKSSVVGYASFYF